MHEIVNFVMSIYENFHFVYILNFGLIFTKLITKDQRNLNKILVTQSVVWFVGCKSKSTFSLSSYMVWQTIVSPRIA